MQYQITFKDVSKNAMLIAIDKQCSDYLDWYKCTFANDNLTIDVICEYATHDNVLNAVQGCIEIYKDMFTHNPQIDFTITY